VKGCLPLCAFASSNRKCAASRTNNPQDKVSLALLEIDDVDGSAVRSDHTLMLGALLAQDPLAFQKWRSPRPRLSGLKNKNALIHICRL